MARDAGDQAGSLGARALAGRAGLRVCAACFSAGPSKLVVGGAREGGNILAGRRARSRRFPSRSATAWRRATLLNSRPAAERGERTLERRALAAISARPGRLRRRCENSGGRANRRWLRTLFPGNSWGLLCCDAAMMRCIIRREHAMSSGSEIRLPAASRNRGISRTTGTTLSREWSMKRCPPPGTMNRRLFGISREMIRALTGGTSGSSAPAITSVGCRILCSQ